ncbi:MAG: DUF1801 domain-containing protein [Blastocatellia bacterium]
MAGNKTKKTEASVDEFIAAIADEKQRADCQVILGMMREATGAGPKMWGPAIVGFGSYHYKYESGREGDWFLTGFSPRKKNLTLYLMAGFTRYNELMGKLGKYKTGQSCLYVNKLTDIDLDVLRELLDQSIAHMRRKDEG